MTPEDKAVQYAYELWYPDREEHEAMLAELKLEEGVADPPGGPMDHPPYRRSVRDFLAGYRTAEAKLEPRIKALEQTVQEWGAFAQYKEDAERWRRFRQIKSINTDKLRPRDWDAMADELLQSKGRGW